MRETDTTEIQETPDKADLPDINQLLESVVSSDEEAIFKSLSSALPKMTEKSLRVLENALSGNTGYTAKEQVSLAKFVLQESIKLQAANQNRISDIIKTYVESQGRLISETNTQGNMVKAATSGAISALQEAFSGMTILGSGSIPKISPISPVTLESPKQVKPLKTKKTKLPSKSKKSKKYIQEESCHVVELPESMQGDE